jgi:hypothetical protein
MKQILHIFFKDARHQWVEILISLAAVAIATFTYYARWNMKAEMYWVSRSTNALGSLSIFLLVLLVPLSWWLLISRVVQEEKLVGDSQFWITRPYEWEKLLTAKLLFLVVFLYVPLMTALCVIVARAGFLPFSFFPGILYDSLLFIGIVALPLVILATVTRNFARLTLVMLGAAVSLIAAAWLASNAPPDRVSIPYEREIGIFLALFLCLAVVVLQYRRRSVRVSWTLLALLVALFGFMEMSGTPNDALMDRTYIPQQPASAAAQFTYREQLESAPSAYVTSKSGWVGISIPVVVSGVADGTVTIPDFLKVKLEAPDGAHWTSVWQQVNMEQFLPGENSARAAFIMPRKIYNAFRGKPINVLVVFALTQGRAGNVRQFLLGRDEFAVSGVGICTPITEFAEQPDEIRGLTCRAPLRQPELTFVRSAWSTSPCGGSGQNTDDRVQTAAWIGSLERENGEVGNAPLWSSPVESQ